MQNFIQEGENLAVVVTHPAVPTSGCVCRFGTLTGVACQDEGAGGVAATETMVAFDSGVYDLNTLAENDNGASAIVAGDSLYYVDADAHLSKKASGYYFGVALEANASGHNVINVLHLPPPGAGTTPGDGTVSAAKLGANAVGTAALSATLGTGYIPMHICSGRIIGTNEIAAVVGAATDPILSRNNLATDKAARLSWASASVIEVQLPNVCYPPDLDDAAAITVCILARMKAGSVDAPVLTVAAFEGEGDTNCGGNTTALSTTLAKKTVTLAASNVGPYPTTLSISIAPGAHNTAQNDVYVFGVWLEYTRR